MLLLFRFLAPHSEVFSRLNLNVCVWEQGWDVRICAVNSLYPVSLSFLATRQVLTTTLAIYSHRPVQVGSQ